MTEDGRKNADNTPSPMTREEAAALAARVRAEVGEEGWRSLVRLAWIDRVLHIVGWLPIIVAIIWFIELGIRGAFAALFWFFLDAGRRHEVSAPMLRSMLMVSIVFGSGVVLLAIDALILRAVRRRLELLVERGYDRDQVWQAMQPHLFLRRRPGPEEAPAPGLRAWRRVGQVLSVLVVLLLGIAFVLFSLRWPEVVTWHAGSPPSETMRDYSPQATNPAAADQVARAFRLVLLLGLLPAAAALGAVHLRIRSLLRRRRSRG